MDDIGVGREFASEMDLRDPLASYRKAFYLADPEMIYLDGNSLGRLPKSTVQRIAEVVEHEWGIDLIRSWNMGWYEAPKRIGAKIARLIGACPEEVILSESTSTNLFKLAMAALTFRPEREKIISDELNFPSDLYILQGCTNLDKSPRQLQILASLDGVSVNEEALLDAIDEETALVSFSHVAFKSGYLYPVESIVKEAHRVGALVLLDLSHSVGVVPMELDRWEVDFAVGCTYKHLNGGPGAPAFLFVHRELIEKVRSPIWGWFGQEAPFRFELAYQPAGGIERFLVGTPPILSLLAIEPGLDLLEEAGVALVREKSQQLTRYLIGLFDVILAPLGFTLGTPREAEKRGSHVSIRHPEGYRINRALIEEMKVSPDFREPDTIRLGLAPLYTSFSEVWEAVNRIRLVVEANRHMRFSSERKAVT